MCSSIFLWWKSEKKENEKNDWCIVFYHFLALCHHLIWANYFKCLWILLWMELKSMFVTHSKCETFFIFFLSLLSSSSMHIHFRNVWFHEVNQIIKNKNKKSTDRICEFLSMQMNSIHDKYHWIVMFCFVRLVIKKV